jgi:hypothetical protein
VADAALALELGDEEADPEARLLALLDELRDVHALQRLAPEQLLAVGGAAAREQEAEHLAQVEHGRVEVARRAGAHRERRRLELAAVVGPHGRGGQVLLQLRR